MRILYDLLPAPPSSVGPLGLALDARGASCGSPSWASATRRSSSGSWPRPARNPSALALGLRASRPASSREYFAGERRGLRRGAALCGTPFQLRVWAELLRIPYGETRSYGEIARSLGSPGASRAVGQANHVNPVAIVVPCHRVIGADGTLTGFGGGLDAKRRLVDFERGQGSFQPELFGELNRRRGATPTRRRPVRRRSTTSERGDAVALGQGREVEVVLQERVDVQAGVDRELGEVDELGRALARDLRTEEAPALRVAHELEEAARVPADLTARELVGSRRGRRPRRRGARGLRPRSGRRRRARDRVDADRDAGVVAGQREVRARGRPRGAPAPSPWAARAGGPITSPTA